MRSALLALASATAIVALAALGACGRGDAGGSASSPSPSPSLTATPSQSPSPSPTPATGNITAHVSCSGLGCATGRLRTIAFDCTTAANLVVATNDGVTLVEGTSLDVAFVDLPAPELDCFHAVMDDTNGGTEFSGGDPQDPQTTTVNGATVEVSLILNGAV